MCFLETYQKSRELISLDCTRNMFQWRIIRISEFFSRNIYSRQKQGIKNDITFNKFKLSELSLLKWWSSSSAH